MTNPSHVRYLLALRRLNKSDGIKSIDVARMLNVTKNSVHHMMETFIRLEYIEKERGGLIFLTSHGIHHAERYGRLYDRIIEKLFAGCLTDDSAEKAICAMIADLSEEHCKILLHGVLTS